MNSAEALLAHVPELRHPARRALWFGLALAVFAFALGFLLWVDRRWPAWSYPAQVTTLTIGFLVAAQHFWRRKEYLRRWSDRAYWNAFRRHIVPGLPLIFAALAHTAFLPGSRLPLYEFTPLALLAGLYFLLVGFALWGRAGMVFGVSNGMMLYVYFPEESRMAGSGPTIYSVIRHPMYSGAVRVGLALGLLRGTPLSLLFGALVPAGMWVWTRVVEEPELLERFGAGYAEYRRTTPAFWPRWNNVGRFWRFLLRGE